MAQLVADALVARLGRRARELAPQGAAAVAGGVEGS